MEHESTPEDDAVKTDTHKPLVYQIRIRSELGGEWTSWFGGMTVSAGGNGDTVLTGALSDQASLYGLLKKVRDLGLFLVSVNSWELDGEKEDNNEF